MPGKALAPFRPAGTGSAKPPGVTEPKSLLGLEEESRALAVRVLEYLKRHPNATDTVAGIARFWMKSDLAATPRKEVERIVMELVEQGLMQRTLKADGEWIYGLVRREEPEKR